MSHGVRDAERVVFEAVSDDRAVLHFSNFLSKFDHGLCNTVGLNGG